MKRAMLALIIIFVAGFIIYFYPYIFSKKIKGVVMGVNHIPVNVAVINGGAPSSAQMFSYSVGIKDPKSSEIFTASSEDRQWGVVQPGQCAEAEFFPYPPWYIKKADTYMNARLIHLYENCD